MKDAEELREIAACDVARPPTPGEYTSLMLPAKPHARGAYPTTTVIDDPAYDHEDAQRRIQRCR